MKDFIQSRLWLVYAIATTASWGIWGAFAGAPVKNNFPETLIYCIWALTMIPPAVVALKIRSWKLDYDPSSICYGMVIGLLGAMGQMILFHAIQIGPPYLIFPIISLSPIITIILSFGFLHERTGKLGTIGIVLAIISLPLFEYSRESQVQEGGYLWFILALLVLVAWGIQAFFIKLANQKMMAESIFFYMMLSALLVTPVAISMTDFSQKINWGLGGPYLAAIIQVLNSVGALLLVYAFRYGKAIVVSPLTNAGAPLITAIISMIALNVIPDPLKLVALGLAGLAAILLALEPEEG